MNHIFEQVFENSPVAMLLVSGSDRKIQLVNKLAEQLFQYQRAELVGQNIEILVPENVRDRHPELVKEYVSAPLPRQMGRGRNLFGVKKDKSLFPIEVGLNPLESDGQIFVLSSVIDITERQKADERFKAAVEAAPSGMLMINSQRKIMLVNRKIEEIFGYSRSELLGAAIEVLVPDDFKAPHPKFVESYLRKPESRSMGIGRELFGKHKSGKLIPVEIGLQPVFSNGEAFVISSVVDITFRKNAEAEIKGKTEELEEFAYRTSHDLRSPLKSISGMADCIAEAINEQDNSTALKNAVNIGNLSKKLITLIEDILTLTKVDTANEPTGEFDFATFETVVREKFKAEIAESKIKIDFNLMHQKSLVVQPTRLTQILDNLIGNAVKYTDKSKTESYLKIRTFNDTHKFFIQIEDNGLGIPAERQPEVFGMFKRFHSSIIPGSGLGLYLVKKQIGKLAAQINFDSSSAGTTFYLEFKLDDHTMKPVQKV